MRGAVECGIVVMETISVWHAAFTVCQTHHTVTLTARILDMGLGTAGTERHLALMAPRRGVGLMADRAGPGGGAVHGLHHAPHPRVALQPRHPVLRQDGLLAAHGARERQGLRRRVADQAPLAERVQAR